MIDCKGNQHVCVIGAGQAGLMACKYLAENNIPFTCYEKGSYLGGMWNLQNDNGLASAYENLVLNTSKKNTSFSDFPMPDEYPHYLTIHQMYDYISSFIERFELHKHVEVNTPVEKITKTKTGVWIVETNQGNQSIYSHVIVASGSNSFANHPHANDSYTGTALHSTQYKTNRDFSEQNVLIVGLGSSGAEIACDLTAVANRVVVSVRKMPIVTPKFLLGRPADHWVSAASSYLPKAVQNRLFKLLIWLTRGNQQQYSVPAPELDIHQHNPTVSDHFLNYCQLGKIHVKRNIAKITEKTVWFDDDSHQDFDRIIYATGYKLHFPFFHDDFLAIGPKSFPLYKNIYHPEHSGLYFLGFIAPRGPVLPLVEKQMQWITNHLQSRITLPDRSTMLKAIGVPASQASQSNHEWRTDTVPKVDMFSYIRLLQNETFSKPIH